MPLYPHASQEQVVRVSRWRDGRPTYGFDPIAITDMTGTVALASFTFAEAFLYLRPSPRRWMKAFGNRNPALMFPIDWEA